jgi:hypothetical protein
MRGRGVALVRPRNSSRLPVLQSNGGALELQAVVPLSWWHSQHHRLRRDARLRHCQLEPQRQHSACGAADSARAPRTMWPYLTVVSQPRWSRDQRDQRDQGKTCWPSGAAGRRSTASRTRQRVYVLPALDCSCSAQRVQQVGRGHWPGAPNAPLFTSQKPSLEAGRLDSRTSLWCGVRPTTVRGTSEEGRAPRPRCRSLRPLFLCRFTTPRADSFTRSVV